MILFNDVLLCYLNNPDLVFLKTSKQVAINQLVFLFFMVLSFKYKELQSFKSGRDLENLAGHPHFTDKKAEVFMN